MKADYNIIYVMGTARSGTTMLGVVLGDNPGIFNAGELSALPRDILKKNAVCSCGARSRECSVWGEVARRLSGFNGNVDSAMDLFHSVERHHVFPLTFFNCQSHDTFLRYCELNDFIFDSIHKVSGSRCIVDTSKYAGRALALSRKFRERVKIIYMTRSPIGLLRAFGKTGIKDQKSKSPWASAAYYCYVLMCSRLVSLLRQRDVCFLTYEDLCAEPMRVLHDLEAWLDLDLSSSKFKIERGDYFPVGHIVTGNRLRHEGNVSFAPKHESITLESRAERFAATAMTIVRAITGMKASYL